MEETFKKVFSKYGASDDQINSFISDFTTGLAITLLLNAENLSPEDEHEVDNLIKSGHIQDAFDFLESKFESKEEWEKYVESQTVALFTNYIKTVVPA